MFEIFLIQTRRWLRCIDAIIPDLKDELEPTGAKWQYMLCAVEPQDATFRVQSTRTQTEHGKTRIKADFDLSGHYNLQISLGTTICS